METVVIVVPICSRSEERRVGKECSYRYYAYTHVNSSSAYIEFECSYGTGRINLNSTWQYSSQWRYRKIR